MIFTDDANNDYWYKEYSFGGDLLSKLGNEGKIVPKGGKMTIMQKCKNYIRPSSIWTFFLKAKLFGQVFVNEKKKPSF